MWGEITYPFQNSMVQSLKIANGHVIPTHTLLGMWLLILSWDYNQSVLINGGLECYWSKVVDNVILNKIGVDHKVTLTRP